MIRRLFSRQTGRILLWLLISLLTLAVLLHAWTNWSGRRRWAATKAMLEHEGETLDFRTLLPETPPQAQNLLAIEPLNGITEAVDHDDAKGAPGAKRKTLEAMKLNSVAPRLRGVESGMATNMQTWAAYLRDSKFLDLPAESAGAGKDVLAALDAKFPVLRQLADLAPLRSQAMFLPGLRERELPEMLFSLSMRHYSGAQNLTRLLCLRAIAAMDAREAPQAVRSLLAAEKICQACEAEPLLISMLVGFSGEAVVNEGLWAGLRERAFTDGELQSLQRLLSAQDAGGALLRAFRGELACAVNTLGYMQDVAAGKKKTSAPVPADMAEQHISLSLLRLRVAPGGLFQHWMSVIAEQEWKHAILPLRQGGISAAVKAGDGMSADLKANQNALLHPDYIMARIALPAVHGVCASAMLSEARQRQALAAMALERFFLKHAKYPATLQELVPEFAPAVPLDPCDGKEMRYRPTAEGRYKLWCVGLDGRDDGGVIKKNGVSMKSPDYLGDWTWSYEPLK